MLLTSVVSTLEARPKAQRPNVGSVHTRFPCAPDTRSLIALSIYTIACSFLMVGTVLIIYQLLDYGACHIQLGRTRQIEDTDDGVRQFDLDSLAVGQMVVLQVFAMTFQCFAKLAMDQCDFGSEDVRVNPVVAVVPALVVRQAVA